MNTLHRIFNPENQVFRQLARLTDIVALSLLWTFLCLPLLTAGLATTALYDTVLRGIRLQQLSATYRRFWQNVKQAWLVSVVATLFWLLVAYLLYYAHAILVFMGNQGNRLAAMLYFALPIVGLFVLGICLWFFLLLSRYEHGFLSGHFLALQLALRHPFTTFLIAALVSQSAQFTARFWWTILFTPAVTAWLLSLFVERIWQKYDAVHSPLQEIQSIE